MSNPMKVVVRAGKRYVFISEASTPTPSKTSLADLRAIVSHAKEHAQEQGRKAISVPFKEKGRRGYFVYVSSEFYPKLCKTVRPSYGTGRL